MRTARRISGAANRDLHKLRKAYRQDKGKSLQRKEIAQIIGVSPFTVIAWLRKPEDKSFRTMHHRDLELLRIKVGYSE